MRHVARRLEAGGFVGGSPRRRCGHRVRRALPLCSRHQRQQRAHGGPHQAWPVCAGIIVLALAVLETCQHWNTAVFYSLMLGSVEMLLGDA